MTNAEAEMIAGALSGGHPRDGEDEGDFAELAQSTMGEEANIHITSEEFHDEEEADEEEGDEDYELGNGLNELLIQQTNEAHMNAGAEGQNADFATQQHLLQQQLNQCQEGLAAAADSANK